MSFTCYGQSTNSGRPHSHETVYEAKVCHGLIRPPQPTTGIIRNATPRQLGLIQYLGGDEARTYAQTLTVQEASRYIDRLKVATNSGNSGNVKTAPVQHSTCNACGNSGNTPDFLTRHQCAAKPAHLSTRSRYQSKVPLLMFDNIPDGYYAWAPDESTALRFIRIKQRKSGKLRGARIVQSQHSDVLEVRWVKWPSGQVSVYQQSIEDIIIGVIVDHQTAARNYARELGRCARCNKRLTDERSRHYSIGPECEQHWPWMIVTVDDENDAQSYEELLRAKKW